MTKCAKIVNRRKGLAMIFTNFMDMHTHSDHSFDGNHSCILLCENAVEKGMDGIAITDHCEIDAKNFDFRAFCSNQIVETFKAKKFFEGRLLVLQGIELGQAVYNLELSNRILGKYKYDFVLGSIHNLRDMDDFFYLDFNKYDVNELLEQYFDTLIELCNWGGFDSLAHLTYPLRYIAARTDLKIDLNKYSDKIEFILKSLIQNGKALEINTSGLFQEIKDFLPNKSIVKWYKDLGGEYITIGSDSHFCNKLGNGIEEGMKMAKECGFDNFTIYQNRAPIVLPIE